MKLNSNKKENLMLYTEEFGYSDPMEAIYDILFDFYECAGFACEPLTRELSAMSEAQLVEAYNNL